MRTVPSNRIGMSRTSLTTWCGKSIQMGYPTQPLREPSTDRVSKARRVASGILLASQERLRMSSTRREPSSHLPPFGETESGIGHNHLLRYPLRRVEVVRLEVVFLDVERVDFFAVDFAFGFQLVFFAVDVFCVDFAFGFHVVFLADDFLVVVFFFDMLIAFPDEFVLA